MLYKDSKSTQKYIAEVNAYKWKLDRTEAAVTHYAQ